MEKTPHFLFTPEIALDLIEPPKSVSIKGKKPKLNYSFTLYDLYPIIPSLDAVEAYLRIAAQYRQASDLISHKLRLRYLAILPPASNEQDVLSILSLLFDPTSYYIDNIWHNLKNIDEVQPRLFHLKEVFPFPLKLASKQKLLHTLTWIDTNIKTKVEEIGKRLDLTSHVVQEIAKAALIVYCYLVKMHDYRLARSINFNYSMFFQDRIINLFFGDELYHDINSQHRKGKLANKMALELLKHFSAISDRQMCVFSVFMGIIWTNSEHLQREYLQKTESALAKIESKLNIAARNWCRDDIDTFLEEVRNDQQRRIVVILDDNGESVFDLALFQRLLNETELLHVAFIVNRYPVSNNIYLDIFNSIIEDPFFSDLKQHIIQGRASIIIEEQVFRSFELELLQAATRYVILDADFVYIKGVNFFETFMDSRIRRFHCFAVHGFTSMLLTGCIEGNGVFVKLEPGQHGFVYVSSEHIQTLIQITTNQSPRTHGS